MPFTDEQVETSLKELVIAHGDDEEAAKNIEARDDGFSISARTLRRWRHDDHRDRFIELERTVGQELEDETISRARKNIVRAAEIEADLLEDIADGQGDEGPSQRLKAVADSKAKNIDKVLALTGRPERPPEEPEGLALLDSMVKSGYLKLNVTIDPSAGQPPEKIVDAEVEPDEPGEIAAPSTSA